MENYLKMAGLTVQYDPIGITETYARPYTIDKPDKIDIILVPDIENMKKKHPEWSYEMCEYLAAGKTFYHHLIDFEGMALHSSAVVLDVKAYLFSAPSGTGKSTHTCLWRRVFGDDQVKILNDDKPALRLEDGIWYAYGTPWSGKTGQNLNLKIPLARICFLERGIENQISRLPARQALFKLLDQTSRPTERHRKENLLDLADKLISQVPIWHLRCNMDPEAAILSYETMSGIRKVEENEN